MNSKTAIYPGTFDPITFGHIDLIQRALKLFPRVHILVAKNTQKLPLFTVQERMALIRRSLKNEKKIMISSFAGLTVDFAVQQNCSVIIRGLRVISDFEHEFQMALTNRHLNQHIETVFLMPNEKYAYLNSTIVKEIIRVGGKVDSFVPPPVLAALLKKYKKKFRPKVTR